MHAFFSLFLTETQNLLNFCPQNPFVAVFEKDDGKLQNTTNLKVQVHGVANVEFN